MDNQIYNILTDMSKHLNMAQMKQLQSTLITRLEDGDETVEIEDNFAYMRMFLSAKQIEGCSDQTIYNYRSTLVDFINVVEIPIREITTDLVRAYLIEHQAINNCSNLTIDNIRRILSSFFNWLEEEDYIIKSPVKRIHKIRIAQKVKKVISDEGIEIMRDGSKTIRDLAMIDFLYSSGIRVGELVKLDIADVDFVERECIVYGKGSKERKVYFDAKTKLHLKKYIDERTDDNPALFVTLNRPHNRLRINGIEIRLREMGRRLGVENVHPHKFRRSMATRAINKGMPVEQLQRLLGHRQIDTTMMYAMVNQINVKSSHKKYIG